CGVFALGIDHFGKTVEGGTRGASSKEADADVVLALLGDRQQAGDVKNPRLAIRKRRTGENGVEFLLRPKKVEMDPDEGGNKETTLVIEWPSKDEVAAAGTKTDRWTTTGLRTLRTAMLNMIATLGTEQQPYPDGPVVRAVNVEAVREEFFKSYPATGEGKA